MHGRYRGPKELRIVSVGRRPDTPECALPHASQCFFDRAQKMGIGVMHAELKLGLGVGVGLVNRIAVLDTRAWYRGLGPVSPSG